MIMPLLEIDHRIAQLKTELDRIYAKQEELLSQIHPELRQDFCMTRADRIRELAESETENYHLLRSWCG